MSLRHGIGSISVRFDDRGFTIIESVVALVIIFGLMLTLLRTFDVSVGVITQSNRRGNANVLASELIERSRSLEWEHMGPHLCSQRCRLPQRGWMYVTSHQHHRSSHCERERQLRLRR